MKRLYALVIAAALCFPSIGAWAWWQSIQQVGVAAAPSFQGPGDLSLSAGNPTMWGSCARVYKASLASTATSLCDLVDSAAPTVVICTLRGTSSGFVDLAGAYCTGSVAPAAKCAAATGGTCNVSKLYDQIGGTAGWTQTTAASQPKLTFSALNSLPGMTFAGAALLAGPSLALTQPTSLSGVYNRPLGASADGSLIGNSGTGFLGGAGTTANIAQITSDGSTKLTVAATDNVFHAYQGVAGTTTANSAVNVDGTETIGNAGTTPSPASISRFGRGNGCCTLIGTIMESGIWATTGFTLGDRGALNTNQHSATNGYNF